MNYMTKIIASELKHITALNEPTEKKKRLELNQSRVPLALLILVAVQRILVQLQLH